MWTDAELHDWQELTLRYPWILYLRFIHLDGVILKVEEDDTFPHTVLLLTFLMHCFLEVRIET